MSEPTGNDTPASQVLLPTIPVAVMPGGSLLVYDDEALLVEWEGDQLVMGFDDSQSLLELPLSRPVTPDPNPSTSGHSTPDVAERENVTTPHTQPSPYTGSQARPPKREHASIANADADEPQRSRPHTAALPRWALDLETRRICEEEMWRELEERRQAIEKQRLAMEKQRLAMEKQRLAIEERRLAMNKQRLAMEKQRQPIEDRRLAMEERRLEEDQTWRRDLLSALQRCLGLLGQPPRPSLPSQ